MKQLYSFTAKLLSLVLTAVLLFSFMSVGVSAAVNATAESVISTYVADFEDNYYSNLKSDNCNAGAISEDNGSKVLDFNINSSAQNYRFEIYNSQNGNFTLNDGKIYAVTINYKVVRIGGEDASAATFINLVRYTGKGNELVKVNIFSESTYYPGDTTDWVTRTIVFKASTASSPEYCRLAVNVVSSSCPEIASNILDNTTSILFDNITITECNENTKSIEFVSNGGSYCDTILGAPGQAITLPEPTRDLYNFAGWYKDPELTSEFKGAAMPSNLTTKLYAKWKVADDAVVINYVSNNGEKIPISVGRSGDALNMPTIERENFNFAGWFNADYTQRKDMRTFPDESTDVFAKWESIPMVANFENKDAYDKPNNSSFTMRCLLGDDEFKTVKDTYSGKYSLHYSFARGFKLSGSAGKGTPAGVMLKDEYGNYIRPVAGKTYVVSFKYKVIQYISARASISLIASASSGPWTDRNPIQDAVMTYDASDVGKGWQSHSFTVEWSEKKSGSNYLNFAIAGESEVYVDDVVVYEYDKTFKPQPDKAMLCFETGGADRIDTAYVDRGSEYTLPEPTREGYRFLGWALDAEGLVPVETETIKLEKAYTKVYAEWYKIPPVVEEPEPEPETESEPVVQEDDDNGLLLYIIIGAVAVVVIAAVVIVIVVVAKRKKKKA